MTTDEKSSPHGVDAPTADQRGTINRRAAMKAALGGAVAAAAWQAPRIDHLSIAPAFGQAATCVPTEGSVSRESVVCDFTVGFTSECYGNCLGLGGDCGPETIVYPSGEGTVTGEFPQGVTMTVTYDGFAEGSFPPGEGEADIVVNGITAPQTCNVTGTHTGCNNLIGQAFPPRLPNSVEPNPVGPYTSTENGPFDMNFGCYNSVGSNRSRVTMTLTLACTCPA